MTLNRIILTFLRNNFNISLNPKPAYIQWVSKIFCTTKVLIPYLLITSYIILYIAHSSLSVRLYVRQFAVGLHTSVSHEFPFPRFYTPHCATECYNRSTSFSTPLGSGILLCVGLGGSCIHQYSRCKATRR